MVMSRISGVCFDSGDRVLILLLLTIEGVIRSKSLGNLLRKSRLQGRRRVIELWL